MGVSIGYFSMRSSEVKPQVKNHSTLNLLVVKLQNEPVANGHGWTAFDDERININRQRDEKTWGERERERDSSMWIVKLTSCPDYSVTFWFICCWWRRIDWRSGSRNQQGVETSTVYNHSVGVSFERVLVFKPQSIFTYTHKSRSTHGSRVAFAFESVRLMSWGMENNWNRSKLRPTNDFEQQSLIIVGSRSKSSLTSSNRWP
jgi:hypothetical protein